MPPKLLSQYLLGDAVQLCGYEDLDHFFACYGNSTGFSVAELAAQRGSISWLPAEEELARWDGRVAVRLSRGEEVLVPFAAVGEVEEYVVEEPDENSDGGGESEMQREITIVRDRASEYDMVQNLAAETIQATFRRYRDCRAAKKLKRVTSTEKLVMDMAADTIRTGIIRSNSRKRLKQNRAGRPPLSVSSLDQQSLASSTTTTAVPVKNQEDLNFDVVSQISTTYHEEDEVSQEEKLVEGEKVHSVVLSPRTSQDYFLSPRDSHRSHSTSIQSSTNSPRMGGVALSPRAPPHMNQLGDNNGVYMQHNEALNRHVPLYVKVSNIKSKNLKSVKWNGNNDPYVVVSIGKWSDETDVIWSAAENISWPEVDIVGKWDCNDDSKMLFTVYNANLIRDDQVIGVSSISLEGIPLDTPQNLEVSVVEQGGKERFRGTVEFQLILTLQILSTTSYCNSHHIGKKEKMADVETFLSSDIQTVIPPDPTPPTTTTEDVDSKPTTLRKANRTKSAENLDGSRRKSMVRPNSVSEKEKSRKKAVSTESEKKIPKSVSQQRQLPGMKVSLPSKQETLPGESKPDQLYPTSPLSSTVQVDDNNNHCDVRKTQGKTLKKKDSSKKKKQGKVGSGNSDKVKDIKRIIDKAYEDAKQEDASAIRLNTYETALVLDALGVELSASPTDFLSSSLPAVDDVADDMSFRSSRSGISVDKDSVLLTLHNPALLAAALSEFVREKDIVKRNLKSSRPFTLTEQQAITATNHLSTLICGNWKSCRKIMLMAATNKGVSSEDNRPLYWGPHWMSKILNILQMPPLDLPESCGEDFMNLTDRQIRSFVKPSILRSRCRLYSKVIKHLNEWWSAGSRPQDPLENEKPENNEDVVPPKKKIHREILDGDYVKIAKTDKLLRAMMPVHRAYAWSTSIEDMTYFCDIVGGMIGMTMKHPPYGSKHLDVQGMKWITFRDDTTLANSNISILSALREFDDNNVEFIAGRCVYIPQACLRKHSTPTLDSSTKFPLKSNTLPLSNLTNCDVKLGMKVKVLDFDSICRAYERFDWWERPSVSSLTNMAGRPGTIVSLPTPTGTDYKRYGVAVIAKNGTEIVDALPPDALEDASIAIAPQKPALKSASAPSNQDYDKSVKKKVKVVDVRIPDHQKPTDTSIRNQSDFSSPIPNKDIPYVRLDSNVTNTTSKALSYLAQDEEEVLYDMDVPNGGDESIPFPEPMSFAEIEENMRLDARVTDVDLNIEPPRRPLYRPVTPTHIDKNAHSGPKKYTSSVPRGNTTDIYSDTNNFGWMRKEVETVDDFEKRFPPDEAVATSPLTSRNKLNSQSLRPKSANETSTKRPAGGRNVKVQSAELNLDNSTTSSPGKNVPRFQININKSRARAEKETMRKEKMAFEDDVKENMLFFDGSEDDIDFGITGLGFTGAKASLQASSNSPMRYPKRPSSANKAIKGTFRPKSASKNPNRLNSNKNDNEFIVQSSKHHVPSAADDVDYKTEAEKAFLKRELRKAEKEAKAKEQSLVSQLKSLGITVQDLDI